MIKEPHHANEHLLSICVDLVGQSAIPSTGHPVRPPHLAPSPSLAPTLHSECHDLCRPQNKRRPIQCLERHYTILYLYIQCNILWCVQFLVSSRDAVYRVVHACLRCIIGFGNGAPYKLEIYIALLTRLNDHITVIYCGLFVNWYHIKLFTWQIFVHCALIEINIITLIFVWFYRIFRILHTQTEHKSVLLSLLFVIIKSHFSKLIPELWHSQQLTHQWNISSNLLALSTAKRYRMYSGIQIIRATCTWNLSH